jgi:hypothetical protein
MFGTGLVGELHEEMEIEGPVLHGRSRAFPCCDDSSEATILPMENHVVPGMGWDTSARIGGFRGLSCC